MKDVSQVREMPPRYVLCWPKPGIEMAFRLLPAGEFRIGSRGVYYTEEPVHLVRISEPFWMAETPVTQEQFAQWTEAAQVPHVFTGMGKPAENINWNEGMSWCAWLNQVKGAEMPQGFKAALPTEAQWEYACRAGTETEYFTGDGEAALVEAGWYEGNSGGETHQVGERKENKWGLYDMHGNVWEWCRDAWDEDAYKKRENGVVDPEVSADYVFEQDPLRVLRGGSWSFGADWCRSSFRFRGWADDRYGGLGFRVCLVRSPAVEPGGGKAGPGKAERGGTLQRSRTGPDFSPVEESSC
jgi:formylglycine-generating enzyme required for sulfatase activity